MDDRFFSKPVLNSPYKYPARHWELTEEGQPTQKIIERRRGAEFVTPIPKPKKRKGPAQQIEMVLDESKGLSTRDQQYDVTSAINTIRGFVDQCRMIPNPNDLKVTSETTRLLKHWRYHRFSNFRPFFCQVEAVETVIWLTEVPAEIHASYLQTLHLVESLSEDEIFDPRRYAWTDKYRLYGFIAPNTFEHYRWARIQIRTRKIKATHRQSYADNPQS